MGREYLKKRMKEKQVTKIKSILKKAEDMENKAPVSILQEFQNPSPSKLMGFSFVSVQTKPTQNPACGLRLLYKNLNQKKVSRLRIYRGR